MKFSVRTFLVSVAVIGVIVGVFGSIISTQRCAARLTTCQNQMRKLGLAMLNYESAFQKFPPASEFGPDAKPWHSWRTKILPFIHSNIASVYEFAEPWNSATNKRLSAKSMGGWIPELFQCCADDHSSRSPAEVSYVVVCAPTTMFPSDRSVTFSDLTDGSNNTILLVESLNTGIFWTEPRDLDFDMMSFKVNEQDLPSISSRHPGGANVIFADGAVYFMTNDIMENELKALLTIAGGEDVTREDLIRRGILK